MTRPWTWLLTGDGQVHATAAAGVTAGPEISAVCGAMVAPASVLVDVGGVDPCLSCVALLGAIDWADDQVTAR